MRRRSTPPNLSYRWMQANGVQIEVRPEHHDLCANLANVLSGVPDHHTPKSIRMGSEMRQRVRVAGGIIDLLLGLPVIEDPSVPEGCVDVVMRDGVTRHRVQVAKP